MRIVFSSIRLVAFSVMALSLACFVEAAPLDPASVPADAAKFLQVHCYDCHQGKDSEGNLDLTAFAEPQAAAASADERTSAARDPLATWVAIFDRVQAGEMPPPESSVLDAAEVAPFLRSIKQWLRDAQQRDAAELGRVRGRRLTNLQLERTLQDLLQIDIPIASHFSDEPRTGGFTTVAEGQPMSHFQLEQHLQAVDRALGEAYRRAVQNDDETKRDFDPEKIARSNPNRRTREPEMRKGLAVVWSSRLEFYGRLPVTTAKEEGWYRFEVTASSLKHPDKGGVWCSVRTGRGVSSAPLLNMVGMFEAHSEPQTWTFDAWLPEGHMLEIRPKDHTLAAARFQGGQVGTGEGDPQDVPGVALHRLTMQRIHPIGTQAAIRKVLFGDLELKVQHQDSQRKQSPDLDVQLISSAPAADVSRLMTAFATQAFRRPVSTDQIQSYVDEVVGELERNKPLHQALLGGYRALLCSPRFLYFQEAAGPLDDYAVASRLSYFLWQSLPDQELLTLASQGKLSDPATLLAQTRRMLDAPRGKDFVTQFADQWLDLRDIDFTEPDPRLYREFDPIVQQSMLLETRTFLAHLLKNNRSVTELIDSDYTFLNSRLARYYDIDDVAGDQMQQVKLSPDDRRGGVLTQGAILKITANGTTTSPVVRGVWLAERLLGDHIPPPPQNVPAIEPDIRGATSIRDMLEKHRNDSACAACHAKIDPPGFALENFDPAGQWRTSYGRDRDSKDKSKKIDPSYVLNDGREFEDLREFRELIVEQPEKIASCVAEKLVTYGTGAAPRFADRDEVQKIVSATKPDRYGFQSLVEQVVLSNLFRSK